VFSELIFPVRTSEFVRVITLARLTGVPLPGPMASALIDRLVDLFVLLLSAVIVYWLSPMGELLGRWLISMLIAAGTLVMLIGHYAKSTGFAEAFVS
jgi:predicted membrane protein